MAEWTATLETDAPGAAVAALASSCAIVHITTKGVAYSLILEALVDHYTYEAVVETEETERNNYTYEGVR